MNKYIYRCFNCSREYSSANVENEFFYLCPKCGKAENNKPLEGVLIVEYDYDALRKKLSREEFLNFTPGKFWLYPDLWPLNFKNYSDQQLKKLALPPDQFLKVEINEKDIWVLDDTRNPTLSYKDRASFIVALKRSIPPLTVPRKASTWSELRLVHSIPTFITVVSLFPSRSPAEKEKGIPSSVLLLCFFSRPAENRRD